MRVEDLFGQAREWMSGLGLEILTPASGEFLIGDVPVLTIRHDRTQAGVLGGIALGDANTVIMPLGPHHLAALGTANLAGKLPPIRCVRPVRWNLYPPVRVQRVSEIDRLSPVRSCQKAVRDLWLGRAAVMVGGLPSTCKPAKFACRRSCLS